MTTKTLIVGAGPFGLGLAAYLQKRGCDYRIVGKPMEFWRQNMPEGMLLRSSVDWYLDPDDQWKIDDFLAEHSPLRQPGAPISRDEYIAYMDWFRQRAEIEPIPVYVRLIEQDGDWFVTELENGEVIRAQQVVLVTGFQYFTHSPEKVVSVLPAGRFGHSCHAVDMAAYRGKRVLLVGGRQSAFETAALLHEAGAARVCISYRHDTPKFIEADWSWVEEIVEQMANQPALFRELPVEEQEEYRYRLWAEGRLKLEPWLESRVSKPEVSLHPNTEVVAATLQPDNSLLIKLSSGEELAMDDVILATGYQVDVKRLPYLSDTIQQALQVNNGFPGLSTQFESNIPGLFFSSFPAGQSFGPFFGFTVGVRTAAKLIGAALYQRQVSSAEEAIA